MIRDQSVLAVIPVRGGSREVPKKNIRTVGGKPLIAWTIQAAKKSRYLDRIVVSTDDREIAETAQKYGCEVPFTRPRELAQDDTPGIEPILHALEMIPGYEFVVMLQATSPLRLPEDVDRCIETCVHGNHNACVSITKPDRSPYWMYTLDKEGKMQPVLACDKQYALRQDLPMTYAINGAVYVAKTEWLKKEKRFITRETAGYLMPQERSIDIDSAYDLSICDWLLTKSESKHSLTEVSTS